ncbi:putative secreted protein [Pseudomonas cerasi]|uniref:Putative secreted protein n=2 Tax=Pseudomonas cerasi TaxID=1583341 RepID=A0A193SRQ1_9PSED|nr:putative secreted protein [Pseudomonas cerasi]SOS21582.1 putative secreted protein [Pseudomonas cerasi]
MNMNMIKVLLILASIIAPSTAWSFTGNDLVEFIPDFEATKGTFGNGLFIGYVIGITELGSGILFCPPSNVTHGQSGAIVVKYLRAHPEDWNWPAATLVTEALKKAYPECPANKK